MKSYFVTIDTEAGQEAFHVEASDSQMAIAQSLNRLQRLCAKSEIENIRCCCEDE